MQPSFHLEQSLFVAANHGTCRCLARSAGFLDEWTAEAERLILGFGDAPAGVRCPAALFAQPFANRFVAVVQVADLNDSSGDASVYRGFRFLIVDGRDYRNALGDPFLLSDLFPPAWHARGELAALSLSTEKIARRSVADLQEILQQTGADQLSTAPLLLGAAQAIVDGSRVGFARREPDSGLLRAIWSLLPRSTRNERWPATFVFSSQLEFAAAVFPEERESEFMDFLTEEQAAEYSEGRYELNLQIAIESGDQHEVDRLFSRRDRAQTFRLGLVLLAGVIFLLIAAKLLQPVFQRRAEKAGFPTDPEKILTVWPPRSQLVGCADRPRTFQRSAAV